MSVADSGDVRGADAPVIDASVDASPIQTVGTLEALPAPIMTTPTPRGPVALHVSPSFRAAMGEVSPCDTCLPRGRLSSGMARLAIGVRTTAGVAGTETDLAVSLTTFVGNNLSSIEHSGINWGAGLELELMRPAGRSVRLGLVLGGDVAWRDHVVLVGIAGRAHLGPLHAWIELGVSYQPQTFPKSIYLDPTNGAPLQGVGPLVGLGFDGVPPVPRARTVSVVGGAAASAVLVYALLECELLDRRRFKTHAEAEMAIFDFIEGFYNTRRIHSALDYRSPVEYERQQQMAA